ncbi:MAG: TonB family protein [Geopsychrobacter sp.]|nr:TonB family protein [Geopsychrobacter sp.]
MRTNHKNLLREKSNLFGLFLLISLLFHLIIALGLPDRLLSPKPEEQKKPIPVTLQERKNWLELDQKPPKVTIQPPKDATHIAEENQQVKQEMAPKAEDSRDQQPSAERAQLKIEQQQPQPKIAPRPARAKPQPQTPPQQEIQPPPAPAERYVPPVAPPKPTPQQQTPPTPIELPKLKNLTRLSPATRARISRQQDRPEIELKDDEVWLNLRRDDKLISFFRRFSDRIEAVWNYPTEAAQQGLEGTLLIKIIINKKGELLDALPIQSSGSDILDYEAIQAIYRAAPFGALPSYYKHEQLKIYAHFQYHLSRRMIYGNP